MPDTRACCLLGVCCPPKQQAAALAAIIEDAGTSEEAAAEILSQFGLVPKDLAAAIVAAYRPMFEAALAAKGGYATTSPGAPGGRAADDEPAKGTPDEGA